VTSILRDAVWVCGELLYDCNPLPFAARYDFVCVFRLFAQSGRRHPALGSPCRMNNRREGPTWPSFTRSAL